MALKALMLRKDITAEENRNRELREALEVFDTREAELEQSIEEAQSEEERSTVSAEVESFESERAAAQAALTASDERLAELREQLQQTEEAQRAAAEKGGEVKGRSAQIMHNNTMELREAQEFQRSGSHTYKDVRSLLRATPLLSTSAGVTGPVRVDGINDGFVGVSSLVDLIRVTDCTGITGYKVAYLDSDIADAAAYTEGSVPTEGMAGFGVVEFAPASYAVIGYVSEGVQDKTPLEYEATVRQSMARSLRRRLNKVAAEAILASTLNNTMALTGAKGSDLIDATLLSRIILSYGGEEDIGGTGVLFLAKEDLMAFNAVRGKNEYLPVYSIVPDASNPSTGIIKDNNGLSCRYCLSKDVKALSTATLTTTATKTMFYGVPSSAELAVWGGYSVKSDPSYKFGEGLLTLRGKVTCDTKVVVKSGFTVVSAKSGT